MLKIIFGGWICVEWFWLVKKWYYLRTERTVGRIELLEASNKLLGWKVNISEKLKRRRWVAGG